MVTNVLNLCSKASLNRALTCYDFYLDRKPRLSRSCELAYLFTAWYFWISLLCVCFMLMTLLMVCVLCCCRNRKNDTSTVLGRILLSLPPTLFTTRDPDGIIQPNVMFYSRPPTRDQTSTAIVARALPPMTAKDRLTTPIMPLNPAYQPSQPVTVTSSTSTTVINSNELTLPPGYVVNRDVKYC
ncbi:unnamed protein product [Larinioides sclopetarius]|uniref:Uncharacterized protein n=1 Tax=Larinioides sclopetarius TaxID=280406 RepID=A0AAV2AXD5_9ARAC